jgi:hypothetical protein
MPPVCLLYAARHRIAPLCGIEKIYGAASALANRIAQPTAHFLDHFLFIFCSIVSDKWLAGAERKQEKKRHPLFFALRGEGVKERKRKTTPDQGMAARSAALIRRCLKIRNILYAGTM